VLRRGRWIIRRRLQGWRIKDIADALRINEKTVDRWWSVYRKESGEGLRVKSRRSHRCYKIPQSTVNLILSEDLLETHVLFYLCLIPRREVV
jgi:transposase